MTGCLRMRGKCRTKPECIYQVVEDSWGGNFILPGLSWLGFGGFIYKIFKKNFTKKYYINTKLEFYFPSVKKTLGLLICF